MNDVTAGALLTLAALAVIGGLMYMRYKTTKKIDLTTADASIVIVLFAVWMLGSGRIAELTVGDVSFKLTAAFKAASNKAVARQTLPVHGIDAEPKGASGQIEDYVARGVEGLTFKLGSFYDGGVIRQYLVELGKLPAFRYVIIQNDDPANSLFGMIGARQLAVLLRDRQGLASTEELADLITNRKADRLAALPGFVTAESALTDASTKQKALEAMQERDLDWFPVVNGAHQLAGVVERSALAASLLVDVVNRLEPAD